MKIFNKTKATFLLFAAVLVAGFAFASTLNTWQVVWTGSQKGENYESRFTIEVADFDFSTLQVGDKVKVTYENAGTAAEADGARADAPRRSMKNYGDIWLYVDEVKDGNEIVRTEYNLQESGEYEYEIAADVIDKVQAANKLIISARNLTVTKVEIYADKEVTPEPQPSGEIVTVDDKDYKVIGINLIENGSFDNGVAGWYAGAWATADASNYTIATEGGFDGGAYLQYSAGGVGSEKNIRGKWNVEIGKTYLFRCYTSGKAPNSNNLQYSTLRIYDESKTNYEGDMLYTLVWGAETEWTLNSFVFTATSDAVTFRSSWTENSKIDGFSLEEVERYYSAESFNKSLNAAKEVLESADYAVVTGEERTVLSNAINTYTDATADKYGEAIDALDAAKDAFVAAKEAYQTLEDAKTEITMIGYDERFPYASTAKKEAAQATLTATATSAADATAKAATIYKAYRQFAESHALAEGVEGATNKTDLIVNPKAEEAIAEPWVTVNGEGSNGSLVIRSNEPWTDGDDNATHKYFDGGNWDANAWDVSLKQEITLPAGKYMMTVKGRASDGVNMTLFAGDNESGIPALGASGSLFNRGWNDASLEFDQAAEGTIAIGVRGVAESNHQWMSFSDFRLVRLGDMTVDEAVAQAQQALQAEIIAAIALRDAEGTYEAGKTELTAAIEAAEGKLNSTDVDELAAALSALKAAEEDFATAQKIAANAEKVDDATALNPVTTDFVENGFFDSDTHAWQSTGGFQNKGLATNQTGAFTGKFWENWNPSAKVNKMYQVVENIPNGLYKLTIAAFVNTLATAQPEAARGAFKAEATQTVQYVFANNDKTYLTTGSPTLYEVYTTVTDNKVEIGLEQTEAVANWMGIDNASLTYYGAETTVEEAEGAAVVVAYNELKDARQSVKTKNDLDAAYQAFTAGFSAETKAALEAAIEASRVSVNSYKILDGGVLPDNSIDGWTCTNSNTFHINTWSVEGNSDGTGMVTPFIENWVARESVLGVGEIYYTLPGLDPGIYSFSALIRAYSESGNEPTGASLFAGNREKEFATGKNFEYNNMKGIFDTYSMAAEVGEDGIFRFGVKIKEERNFNWMAFKNCKVAYVGGAIDAAAVAELAKTMPEGKMNTETKEAMEAAKAIAEATPNLENYEAFSKAIAAAEASVAAYAKAKAALDGMKNILDGTNVYTQEAFDAYNGIYTSKLAAYNDGTLSDGDAVAMENPEATMGWHAANIVDDLLLSAWSIGETKAKDYDAALYINTWSVEGNNDGSNFKVPFFEYWTGDGESLGANTISAEMTGLEAGEYEVNAWVRVRVKNGAEAPATGISMQMNEGEAVAIVGEQVGTSQMYLQDYTATGTVAEDGVLKIKFDVAAENNVSWLSFKNVKYVFKQPTGINEVSSKLGQNDAIYNLRGQKVQKAQKGLYIINGKKVMK